jgi:DNA-binding transcriptional ArsR family regulator
MPSINALAETAGLVGDPARAAMLAALMDGRALTAGELATIAGIAAPTASGHLAKLTAAGLLAVERQGRHRYHRLASPGVARMLEGLMAVAEIARPNRLPTGPRDAAMRAARTCYDHLAGQLAVALADAMVARGVLELGPDGGAVTPAGLVFLETLGIALPRPGGGRVFCRPCLDWSERRPHVAGQVGAALCTRCLDLGWVRRRRDGEAGGRPGGRTLLVTPEGARGFREAFGVAVPASV